MLAARAASSRLLNSRARSSATVKDGRRKSLWSAHVEKTSRLTSDFWPAQCNGCSFHVRPISPGGAEAQVLDWCRDFREVWYLLTVPLARATEAFPTRNRRSWVRLMRQSLGLPPR